MRRLSHGAASARRTRPRRTSECVYAQFLSRCPYEPLHSPRPPPCSLPRSVYRVASESPRMRRVSWMSLTMTVTRRECIAQRLESSNSRTR